MNMADSENFFFKTAELVRDTVGCYYFVCIQCGKYFPFKNVDEMVDHIEKYFCKSSDDCDLLTPMINSETECNVYNDDVAVTNIKKESLEEYEDYKLYSPQVCEEETNASIYCPICSKTLNSDETSLESHLITVHRRSRNHAKIFECNICGRNTYTRSYDLHRHQLIHVRDGSNMIVSEPLSSKSESDRTENSVLFNILSQDIKQESESDVEAFKERNVNNSRIVLPSSVGCDRKVRKRKLSQKYIELKQQKEIKSLEEIETNRPNYCSICQQSCSKTETLQSHLIRVHRRNKLYAKVYECSVCGKNTFTRPYDLRRHERIHAKKKITAATLPHRRSLNFQPSQLLLSN